MPDDGTVIVTFTSHYGSYNAGEAAAFSPEEAARLKELGVIEGGTGDPDAPAVKTDINPNAADDKASTATDQLGRAARSDPVVQTKPAPKPPAKK